MRTGRKLWILLSQEGRGWYNRNQLKIKRKRRRKRVKHKTRKRRNFDLINSRCMKFIGKKR